MTAGVTASRIPSGRAGCVPPRINAWEDRTKEDTIVVVYFRRATELDPGYAGVCGTR